MHVVILTEAPGSGKTAIADGFCGRAPAGKSLTINLRTDAAEHRYPNRSRCLTS
jgi:tRNA uridine 5-carbamoylmethylation protein Kti12